MPDPTPNPQGGATPPAATPAPPAGGQPSATPTPGAQPTGAPAQGQPSGDQDKNVPIQALHEERDKRQQLQAQNQTLQQQLDQLKAQFQVMGMQQYGQPGMGQQQQMPQQRDIRAELEQLWETDPRKAMQTEMQMGFQWYDQVNASVEAQLDELSQKHPDFNQYRPEVRKYLHSIPIQQRTQQGVPELAYYTVKGQRVDDIVKAQQEELLKKIRAGEQVQGLSTGATGSPAAMQTQGGVQYTPQQAAVAQAMGMSVEDYLKHAKK